MSERLAPPSREPVASYEPVSGWEAIEPPLGLEDSRPEESHAGKPQPRE
ncbi:MAG: hypothetical protein AB7N76_08230 [Planctomycetota bacterium]